jgi:hypothetical protein
VKQPPPLPDAAAEPVTLSLGEAMDTLDRQARIVVKLIERDPATATSTHEHHATLAAIATAISDVLIALAKRRM